MRGAMSRRDGGVMVSAGHLGPRDLRAATGDVAQDRETHGKQGPARGLKEDATHWR